MPARLLRVALVMFVSSGAVLAGGIAANAGTTLYASWVMRSEHVRIQSGTSTLKGGEVNLHMDWGGYVNAASYGQLRRGAGSTAVTLLNFTGGRMAFAGGSLATGQSSSYNSAWWDWPGSGDLGQFPLSGKTIW